LTFPEIEPLSWFRIIFCAAKEQYLFIPYLSKLFIRTYCFANDIFLSIIVSFVYLFRKIQAINKIMSIDCPSGHLSSFSRSYSSMEEHNSEVISDVIDSILNAVCRDEQTFGAGMIDNGEMIEDADNFSWESYHSSTGTLPATILTNFQHVDESLLNKLNFKPSHILAVCDNSTNPKVYWPCRIKSVCRTNICLTPFKLLKDVWKSLITECISIERAKSLHVTVDSYGIDGK